jgi:fibronectin type 3 domain-containing protein
MKVFGLRYLEKMQSNVDVSSGTWKWKPKSGESYRIYASGNSTRSRESTYASEKDNRADEDRPNEGLAA